MGIVDFIEQVGSIALGTFALFVLAMMVMVISEYVKDKLF